MPTTVVSTDIDESLEREASEVLAGGRPHGVGRRAADVDADGDGKGAAFQSPRRRDDARIQRGPNSDCVPAVQAQSRRPALASNFVAVGTRMRWDFKDLQRGLVYAFEHKWVEKAPDEDGGIRLTATGFEIMQRHLVDAAQ